MPPIQEISWNGEKRLLLRLDLPDPLMGGNKAYKLKYNLEAFRNSGKKQILSFGGAYSNHLAALAATGKKHRIETIGIVRGDELKADSNPVLRFASDCGMELCFISREEYRLRNDPSFVKLLSFDFPDAYIVPEGGANQLAVQGCMEILSTETNAMDYFVCAVGTGATLAGIILAAQKHQHVIGIAVLEGKNYLENEVSKFLLGQDLQATWEINENYTLGGYAQVNEEFTRFIAEMSEKHKLPLDPVYSGKSFFGFDSMHKQGLFDGKKALFIHTGGYAFYQ
jgi:1-aminocyclopropane-1-carboxylate deaminase